MDIKRFVLLRAAVLAVLVFSAVGCVNRKLTINTEPQGAIVVLNDEEIGVSPVTVGFSWYGDYKIRIEKEGFDTLSTHRMLKGPLHDKFPFDFFAEVLWPGQITDEYDWTFALEPYSPPQRAELIRSAEAMRERTLEAIAAAKASNPETAGKD